MLKLKTSQDQNVNWETPKREVAKARNTAASALSQKPVTKTGNITQAQAEKAVASYLAQNKI